MSLVNKCILLIDDDKEIVLLTKRVLENAGANFFSASTVSDGIDLACTVAPHIVIVDLHIPGNDGFSFLEKRKETMQLQNIPTIVFTAETNKDELNKAMALHATDYLNKPLNASQLLQKIRKSLHTEDHSSRFTFKNPLKIQAQINAKIIGINNEFIFIESAAKLGPGKILRLESKFLDSCKMKNQILKVTRRSIPADAIGQYFTRAKFMGLNEEVTFHLNRKIKDWK